MQLKTRKPFPQWEYGDQVGRFWTSHSTGVPRRKEENHLWYSQLYCSWNFRRKGAFLWSWRLVSWRHHVIIHLSSYTQLIGKPPFETPEVKATYRKIKACTYDFPEHLTISDNARNLIKKILVLDPSQRPTLEEILSDPFMGDPIPKTMPRSTLACPPAKNFTDQFVKSNQSSQQQLSSKPSSSTLAMREKEEYKTKEPTKER